MTADSFSTADSCAVSLFAHIAARLEQLRASHWTAVVLAWLVRYDGISRCYFADEEDAPTLEVLRCLNALPADAADPEIASALAGLEFLTWRVRHPDTQERWDPLHQSLLEFMGGAAPDCWRWEGACPPSEAVAAWLLDQLPHP